MASKKKKAVKAGSGAVAAGKAAKDNPYVHRLIEDDELRDNLRTAFDSARKAYERMSSRQGPAKALLDDKKTQKELKEAANSLKDAADALRGGKRGKKKRRGGLLLLLIGAGAAIALNEGLRKKLLDTLFGAEEEFEYTSTTTPSQSGSGSSSSSGSGAQTPVGSS